MKRLVPFVVVGFVLELLGLALSSALLAFAGVVVLGIGVVSFVLGGTGTRLDREVRER